MNKETAKQNLIASIPYLSLLLGLGLFSFGTFGNFTSDNTKEFFSGLGKAILVSGVFALLLKTIQFMGIIKNELREVIYEPSYLANRKDLPDIWEGVSKELFKNKFAGISKKLMKDVTEVYFPTEHATYYDDMEHFIEIKYTLDGRVEVHYSVSLNVICSSSTDKCTYEYSSILNFEKDSSEVEYLCKGVKVNDEVVKPQGEQTIDGKQVTNTFQLPLVGKEKYKIERKEAKKYFLDTDNMTYFRAAKISNNLTIDIHHPDDLTVVFKKCGTINDFVLRNPTTKYKQYRYSGILYPQQGYIFTLNKKA